MCVYNTRTKKFLRGILLYIYWKQANNLITLIWLYSNIFKRPGHKNALPAPGWLLWADTGYFPLIEALRLAPGKGTNSVLCTLFKQSTVRKKWILRLWGMFGSKETPFLGDSGMLLISHPPCMCMKSLVLQVGSPRKVGSSHLFFIDHLTLRWVWMSPGTASLLSPTGKFWRLKGGNL